MTDDVLPVARVKDVDLVRALVATLAKVAPPRDAELAEALVAQLAHTRLRGVDLLEAARRHEHVHDRLGG
nr:hypothetical protein [Olsenella uli]